LHIRGVFGQSRPVSSRRACQQADRFERDSHGINRYSRCCSHTGWSNLEGEPYSRRK
jgi:hypothetical protein